MTPVVGKLLLTALSSPSNPPVRFGTVNRPELGPGILSYNASTSLAKSFSSSIQRSLVSLRLLLPLHVLVLLHSKGVCGCLSSEVTELLWSDDMMTERDDWFDMEVCNSAFDISSAATDRSRIRYIGVMSLG